MGFRFTFKHRVIPIVKAERFIPIGEHCEASHSTCPYLKASPEGVSRWCSYLRQAIDGVPAAGLTSFKPCGLKLDGVT